MKKTTLLKTMLLLCALVAGSGSVWAKQYKKVTSSSELVNGAKYLIVTSSEYSNASDPVVSSQYLTIGKVNSNNRTGVEVTISGEIATATVATGTSSELAHEIMLVQSGENWNLYDVANAMYLNGGSTKSSGNNNYLKTAASAETGTGQSKNNGVWSITISEGVADIQNQNNFHLRFNPNLQGSKGSKVFTPILTTYNNSNYTTYYAVSLYKEIAEPVSAIDGISAASITYSSGTLTDGVWTMTTNTDYKFQCTTDGKAVSKRAGTTYFKIPYPADFKITVPSTIAVSKIAITGYSSNTSSGTNITIGGSTQTIKSESTLYFDIASPSAGDDITFSTANKEMDIISIELFTADGKTLTTSANMDGWRAFYDATQDYEADANTKIYVAAKSETTGSVTLTEVAATKIPHGEAVILKTSAGDHKMVLTKATGATTLGANVLAYAASAAVDGYRLGFKTGTGVAFYKYTATAPASGVVYIDKANVNTGAGAPEFLGFDFGSETTAIQSVNAEKANVAPRKMLKEGRIVIETAEGTFLMNGSRVK